jgi:hypothetical protein
MGMQIVHNVKMERRQSKALTVVLVLTVLLSWVFLNYGLEYNKAYQASKRAKEVERAYVLIESAMDRYVEKRACLPASLKDLELKNLPIPIERIRYVNNTNECVISFHDPSGFNLYRPRYYSGLIRITNFSTNTLSR